MRLAFVLATALSSSSSLAAPKAVAPRAPQPAAAVAPPGAVARDWTRAPAVVTHAPLGRVYAVSDLHGRYDEAVALFRGNGLLRTSPRPGGGPGEVVEWTGKNATLVVVGDVINKGPGSVELIDLLRSLQASAEKGGGKVIVTMGNHEALFLSDPLSERSLRDGTGGKSGLGGSLLRRGVDPTRVAAGLDPEGRGAWLRSLPFAAHVGDSFFLHSGSTGGRSSSQIVLSIQNALEHGGFGHRVFVGDASRSLLGAEDWELTAAVAKENAARLGVKRIVMGHVPEALGAVGHIAETTDGALVKLDTGFGNAEGPPRLARFDAKGRLVELTPSGARAAVLHAGP